MYRFGCSGIAGGKTIVAVFDAVRHFIEYPGIRGIIAAPTHKMLNRATLPALRKVVSWWGDDLVLEEHKSDQEISFPQYRNEYGEPSMAYLAHCSEPESLRGPDVAFFVGDEAALWKERAFQLLQGRIRQPGYPHRGWVVSTPKGKNWLYRTFVEGRDEWSPGKRGRYGFHNWKTGDNPLHQMDPEYLVALIESYGAGTDFYKQEILGLFVAFAGLVYREWAPQRHAVAQAAVPKHFLRVIAGVDWGQTSHGCIIVFGVGLDGKLYLLDEVYERGKIIFGGEGHADWVAEGKAIQKRFPDVLFVADPSDVNAIATFNHNGLPTMKANNLRVPGVRVGQALLAADRLQVVEGVAPNFEAEIEQYHWREDPDGNPLEDMDPAKEFDHAMDAARYAWMEIERPTTDVIVAPHDYSDEPAHEEPAFTENEFLQGLDLLLPGWRPAA